MLSPAMHQFESFLDSMSADDEGAALLRAAHSGDEAAQRVLLDRFEVFAEAMAFLGYSNSWLPRLATRLSRRLRLLGEREVLSLDAPAGQLNTSLLVTHDGPDFDYLAVPRDLFSRADLALAADAISEWQWTCLSLTVIHGFTERDVGLARGVSQQAVHKAKMKAIAAFRAAASKDVTET